MIWFVVKTLLIILRLFLSRLGDYFIIKLLAQMGHFAAMVFATCF